MRDARRRIVFEDDVRAEKSPVLDARRDKYAAQRYFEQSMVHNGVPETVTIDHSGANLAALKAINVERETPIHIRQRRYLNNIVEQDHRSDRCWDSRDSAVLVSY